MKLKLDINTTRLSFRAIGIAAVALGVLLALVGIVLPCLLVAGVILVLVGLALISKPHDFLIRYPQAAVLAQISKTLDMIGWQYSRENDMIGVPDVQGQIRARSLGGATLLTFRFGGPITKREAFLVSALVKFQRYTETAKE